MQVIVYTGLTPVNLILTAISLVDIWVLGTSGRVSGVQRVSRVRNRAYAGTLKIKGSPKMGFEVISSAEIIIQCKGAMGKSRILYGDRFQTIYQVFNLKFFM